MIGERQCEVVEPKQPADFYRTAILLRQRRQFYRSFQRHRLVLSNSATVENQHLNCIFVVATNYLNQHGIEVDTQKIARLQYIYDVCRVQIEVFVVPGHPVPVRANNRVVPDRQRTVDQRSGSNLGAFGIEANRYFGMSFYK